MVIVTEGLWRRFFNADRDSLNRHITPNGRSFAVIGALPPNFQLYQTGEIFAPIGVGLCLSVRRHTLVATFFTWNAAAKVPRDFSVSSTSLWPVPRIVNVLFVLWGDSHLCIACLGEIVHGFKNLPEGGDGTLVSAPVGKRSLRDTEETTKKIADLEQAIKVRGYSPASPGELWLGMAPEFSPNSRQRLGKLWRP